MEGGGLELVEMYACTWGPPVDDISGWVGLWVLTLLIGGVPTALLMRSAPEHPST